MTDVVRRMIEVGHRLKSFNIAEALRDDSGGMRLFAYAFLYTRPNAQFLVSLVETVTSEEHTPFGQYWGLQSIGRVMSNATHVPPEIKNKLHAFGTRLPRGTDREYEVRKLLRQADENDAPERVARIADRKKYVFSESAERYCWADAAGC